MRGSTQTSDDDCEADAASRPTVTPQTFPSLLTGDSCWSCGAFTGATIQAAVSTGGYLVYCRRSMVSNQSAHADL